MAGHKRRSGTRKAGSKILVQIIIMILIVFIGAGTISFIVFKNSQNRVIQKSKDKLVEYKGDLMCSTNQYVTNIITQIVLRSTPGATLQSIEADIVKGFNQGVITPAQKAIDEMLSQLVDEKFFNSDLALYALPPESGAGYRSMIVMCSDENYVYEELPEELRELASGDTKENSNDLEWVHGNSTCELFVDGVPGLGLEGEYLVSTYSYKPDPQGGELWFFDFSSMHDELAGIESFYKTESRKINKILIILMVATLAALVVITFLALSYLIRKKITRPIDELEEAAEKAMDGDLEVEVPIREGEEFEGLKIAFNNMLGSLRRIINKSLGTERPLDDKSGKEPPGHEDQKSKVRKHHGRGRSSIFFQTTVLVIVIFIISGTLAMLFFYRSQETLAEASRQKVVKSMAEAIGSGHLYVSSLVERYYLLVLPDLMTFESTKGLLKAIKEKKANNTISILNDALQDYPKQGFNGLILAFETMPPTPGLLDNPTIILSSDKEIVFMELPEELIKLHDMTVEDNSDYRARIDEDTAYVLVEDGLPYFGLSGEYLVMNYNHEVDKNPPVTYWFYNIKPMSEELAEINSFYNSENRKTLIIMGILLLVSIIAVAIITVFVLGYLIRTRITNPIDELSTVAEQVMDGELDVEIPVRKGEEFEGLKSAFNEMLKSLRDVLAGI
ncbi:MAG: HAMP domain-containing protein [Actinobacteria bacterium]|nr:HAMP domain-containing protein [Actinomycetota bacterium]